MKGRLWCPFLLGISLVFDLEQTMPKAHSKLSGLGVGNEKENHGEENSKDRRGGHKHLQQETVTSLEQSSH
jgi:hypothetical protein